MYTPTIWPAIDLVFFQSHRLTNQNNFAAVCTACDAYIVLRIIGPTPQEAPQIHDLHCNPRFLRLVGARKMESSNPWVKRKTQKEAIGQEIFQASIH
jgi:hypothetical protein